MATTRQLFEQALARQRQPAPCKLIDPGFRRFYRRWRARRSPLPQPCETSLFFGPGMTVVLPEVISEAIYTYGLFDETVTWMALNVVRPGDVVFDVGAHFGYFSLLFAHLAGLEGNVFSFEPTPTTYAVLESNARRIPGIIPINCAAGDNAGAIEIADFGVKHSAWNTVSARSRMPHSLQTGAANRIKVNVIRLDQFAAERAVLPDFVKIDAENFEHAVVAGLSSAIKKSSPVLLIEAGSESALSAALPLVSGQGYQVYVSDGPGSLYKWQGTLERANAHFKDILLIPAHRPVELLPHEHIRV